MAAKAGEVLKMTVLELGGSDPYLIPEDADLERGTRIASEKLEVWVAWGASARRLPKSPLALSGSRSGSLHIGTGSSGTDPAYFPAPNRSR